MTAVTRCRPAISSAGSAGAPALDCPSRVVDLVSPQPPLTPGVDSSPADLTPFGGKLLFTALIPRETAADPSAALLVSDGTAAGTSVLARLEPWSESRFRSIVAVGDRAFVVGQTPTTSGYGLWTTDGTPEGTALVFDGFLIWSNALVPMGGDVYFHAGTYAPDVYPAYTDGELWRSDGTRAGAVRVKDVCPGACTSIPSFVPPLADEPDGYLFFTAKDPEHGTRLWRSDGTEARTFLVEDRAAGAEGTPWALARVGDLVYFGLPCPPEEDPSRSSLQLWAVPVDLSDRAAPAAFDQRAVLFALFLLRTDPPAHSGQSILAFESLHGTRHVVFSKRLNELRDVHRHGTAACARSFRALNAAPGL